MSHTESDSPYTWQSPLTFRDRDAWAALSAVCEPDSAVTICAAYREFHRMVYQPGTSLMGYITKFKLAYIRLLEQSEETSFDFGTVTPFMAAAVFLDSLENDTELTSIVQSCYDIRPFNLNMVTKHVSVEEAVRRLNRNLKHQSAGMTIGSSESTSQSKSFMTENDEQKEAQKPPAVAPSTISSNPSSSKPHHKSSHLSCIGSNKSDTLDRTIERPESSVGQLTEMMKKLTPTDTHGIAPANENASNEDWQGPFDSDSDSDCATYIIGTIMPD